MKNSRRQRHSIRDQKLKRILIGIGSAILLNLPLSQISMAADDESNASFFAGVDFGFGAPYGNAIEVGRYFTDRIEANVGIGFNMSGSKVGVGCRNYYFPSSTFSPFVGANIVHSSGISSLNVTVNQDKGVYRISDNNLAHASLGLRIKPVPLIAFLVEVGYGWPFAAKKAEYVSGTRSQTMDDTANFVVEGGLSVTASGRIQF